MGRWAIVEKIRTFVSEGTIHRGVVPQRTQQPHIKVITGMFGVNKQEVMLQ